MAAVTLSMLLVAIHFETAGGLCGVWQEDGSAGQWRKEPNMAATTGRPTWEACSTHEHSRAPHLPLHNRGRRRRSTTHKNSAGLEARGVARDRGPAVARHVGKSYRDP